MHERALAWHGYMFTAEVVDKFASEVGSDPPLGFNAMVTNHLRDVAKHLSLLCQPSEGCVETEGGGDGGEGGRRCMYVYT